MLTYLHLNENVERVIRMLFSGIFILYCAFMFIRTIGIGYVSVPKKLKKEL